MALYFVQELVNDNHDKSKISFFYNNLLNVDFSITIADTEFKFCFPILHIHLERTVSQIFYLGFSFYLCQKSGNIFYIT